MLQYNTNMLVQSGLHTMNKTYIEMVQRRAAWFVMNEYNRIASVSEMLNALQWHTLGKL